MLNEQFEHSLADKVPIIILMINGSSSNFRSILNARKVIKFSYKFKIIPKYKFNRIKYNPHIFSKKRRGKRKKKLQLSIAISTRNEKRK